MMIDKEARFEELPMDEPSLELKTLPYTLKYAFFDEEKEKPVIILSKLNIKLEEQLLEVLRLNEEAIGWTLRDLKGLDPNEMRPRGHRFHAVSRQKLFRTYQFGELRVN